MGRGEEYPAYKGEQVVEYYSSGNPHVERMETSHSSFSLGPKFLKNHIPAKVQWDGTTTGFQDYKYAMEGFYTQSYSSYLFDSRFHSLYVKHGPSKVIDHPDLPKYIKITQPQLDEAKAHLYGAIKASTRKSNTVKKTNIGMKEMVYWYG